MFFLLLADRELYLSSISFLAFWACYYTFTAWNSVLLWGSSSSRCNVVAAAVVPPPRSGELRTQKVKSHLVRTQSLNVLPLMPWSRSVYSYTCYAYCQGFFFLAYFCTSGPFTCIFFKTSPDFFPVLAVANTSSCVGPQNKPGHPVWHRFPCWVPAEYKQTAKTWLVVWWLLQWIT